MLPAFITDPKTKETAVAPNQVCNLEKLIGTGTDPSKFSTRWYFDSMDSLMCVSFLYSGIGGNKNNFKTKAECLRKCSHAGNKTFYDINLSIVSIMGTNSHKLTLKTQLFFQLGMSVLFLSCLVFVWPIFPDGFITAKLKNVNLSFMVDVMVMPTTLTPRRIVRSLV